MRRGSALLLGWSSASESVLFEELEVTCRVGTNAKAFLTFGTSISVALDEECLDIDDLVVGNGESAHEQIRQFLSEGFYA